MSPRSVALSAGRVAWCVVGAFVLLSLVGFCAGCAQFIGGLTPEQTAFLASWCEKGCYTATQGPFVIFIPDEIVQAAEDAAKGQQRP